VSVVAVGRKTTEVRAAVTRVARTPRPVPKRKRRSTAFGSPSVSSKALHVGLPIGRSRCRHRHGTGREGRGNVEGSTGRRGSAGDNRERFGVPLLGLAI